MSAPPAKITPSSRDIEPRLAGASSAAIIAELAKLQNVLPSSKRSEGEWRQALKLYVEALAVYPRDVLHAGIVEGVRRWKRFPTIAAICEACDPLMAALQAELKRAMTAEARAAQARIDHRGDAEPISPEVRHLVRAAAEGRRIKFRGEHSWEIEPAPGEASRSRAQAPLPGLPLPPEAHPCPEIGASRDD